MKNTKSERLEIGRRLRAARERAHISIEDAAQEFRVQPLAVERWERGAGLPSLLEMRSVLELYGVMGYDILLETNPMELSPDQASELTRASRGFSTGLQVKVNALLAIMAKGCEPAWRESSSAR